jgi:hypothetical protein
MAIMGAGSSVETRVVKRPYRAAQNVTGGGIVAPFGM